MNVTESSLQLWHGSSTTCWQRILQDNDSHKPTVVAILCILSTVVFVNLSGNVWCAAVMFTTPKLRKPTWLFKGSMAIKDTLLVVGCAAQAFWNIRAGAGVTVGPDEQQNFRYSMVYTFNVLHAMCLVASFAHMLIICFDRQQAISRPFRYHTDELLPYKVSLILVVCCWTFCFVVGLSVTSESLGAADRSGLLETTGTAFPIYRMPSLQKWLLGAGMGTLFVITISLLALSLHIEIRRKRERRAAITSGVAVVEPLRSRNNSVCHSKTKPAVYASQWDSTDNSEADANDFLMGGGFSFRLKDLDDFRLDAKPWSATSHSNTGFFTPVDYRPSIRRRIRDTWSLYSAAMCFCAFILTCVVPFIVIYIVDWSSISSDSISEPSAVYCITSVVMEFLFLSQGVCYISIYVITDDVFRPYFARPFRLIKGKVIIFTSHTCCHAYKVNKKCLSAV